MHWSLFARMQITIILLQVWTLKCIVDAQCVKANTSSQLFKRESDCRYTCCLFFTVLDLDWLFFALFSVNIKMCWHTHTHTLQISGTCGEPCGDLLQQSRLQVHLTIRSDDLQTAVLLEHNVAHMHHSSSISNIYVPWNPETLWKQLLKWWDGRILIFSSKPALMFHHCHLKA